jgi:hypothetical protein
VESLIYHDINSSDFPNLREIHQSAISRVPDFKLFNQNSPSDERCHWEFINHLVPVIDFARSVKGTRGVAPIQNTKKISIRAPRLTDWQHAARPGPTFRGEIGIDAGDFLNNKRGLLAALVLRDNRELFKVGSDRSADAEVGSG